LSFFTRASFPSLWLFVLCCSTQTTLFPPCWHLLTTDSVKIPCSSPPP
jgi:hypothetical protein